MTDLNNVMIVNKYKCIPPIHEATANDDLRAVLNYVYVNKDEIVASDAHIMVVHNTEEVFNEDFRNGFPDKPFLIFRSDWKKLTIAKVEIIYWLDDITIGIAYKNVDRHDTIRVVFEESEHFTEHFPKTEQRTTGIRTYYPQYKNVWPDDNKLEQKPLTDIGLKPEFLLRVSKAMGNPTGVALKFYSPSRAIIVTPLGEKKFEKANGLVMPMMPQDVSY